MFSFLGSKDDKSIHIGDTVIIKNGRGYVKAAVGVVAFDDCAMPLRVESYYGNSGKVGYQDFIFLMTNDERYISVADDLDNTVSCSGTTADAWELFKLVKPPKATNDHLHMGDNVAFQSAHGSFLTQSGNTLHCRATEIGPEQIFQVEKSLYTIDTKPKRKPVLSVAFGDYIRLKHIKTGQVLHSHDLEYKTGSLRHQVTCFDGRDENDWWQIESAKNETGYVKYGSTIKLRHEATGRRLYTVVGYQSPSTDQQEVCCYNTDDGNDRWKVVGGTGALEANNTLQLTHIASDVRLHSHKNTFKIFGEGLSKQQEVTAFGGHDDNDHWTICEIRGRCKME